jgi:hypothetical protein
MISEARKKILLDIFGSPIVLLPSVVGIGSLILSWAIGGSSFFNFLSLVGLLVSGGGFITRITSGDLLIKQKKYEQEEQFTEQETKLNELNSKLSKDTDSRTQSCLREIRQIYCTLRGEVEGGGIGVMGQRVYDSVGDLFKACIDQLEQVCELRETSKRMRGKNRKNLEAERGKLIEDVLSTAGHLSESVEQFRLWQANKKSKELSRLRKQLDEQMKTARQVEQKIGAISGELSPEVDAEFEQFVKENKNE